MNKIVNFNKSDLAFSISKKLDMPESIVLLCIENLISDITINVALGKNIEIRGFGVFSKKYIRPRRFMNPKTKEIGYLGETASMHFKSSKKLLNSNG